MKGRREGSFINSYKVEEWSDEESQESGPASSDYSDSDLGENEEVKVPEFDRGLRKDNISSAHPKRRKKINQAESVKRSDSIPSMSRHARRNKKIPGSVRKPTNTTITIIKSPIEGGSENIFFNYPKYVGEDKDYNGKLVQYDQKDMKKCKLVLKISESTHIYNSVVNSCKNAGFYLTDVGKDWNLLWTSSSKTEVLRTMNKFQRMNHFPSGYQLGRKDLMWKNISRQKRQFGSEYNICPKTYIFPHDYRRFIIDAKSKDNKKAYYIMKPVASSCANGIKILNAQMGLPKNKKGYVISKYITKPHLIKGYKYDMRIYVLVTSYDPLVVYMYRDGLVRFCSEKYSLSSKSFKRFSHLTNYSVNKKAENYK